MSILSNLINFFKPQVSKKEFHYPICLDLKDLECLIVGANRFAEEKVGTLLKYGAKVRVVSPGTSLFLEALSQEKKIVWEKRDPVPQDIDWAALVIATEQNGAVNEKLYHLCKEKRKIFNAVDDTRWCRFIVPAIARAGLVHVSVCTQGTSPALACHLRDKIKEQILPDEVGELAKFLGEHRQYVLEKLPAIEKRRIFWQSVVKAKIPYPLPSKDANRWMKEKLRAFI